MAAGSVPKVTLLLEEDGAPQATSTGSTRAAVDLAMPTDVSTPIAILTPSIIQAPAVTTIISNPASLASERCTTPLPRRYAQLPARSSRMASAVATPPRVAAADLVAEADAAELNGATHPNFSIVSDLKALYTESTVLSI